jgi:hypothetical protein
VTYSILLSSRKLVTGLEYLIALAVFVAIVRPRWAQGFYSTCEQAFRKLAANRRRAMLAAAALPLLARAAMLPWFPPPPPQIHDEFSYLLQGDTFAHGRIANPTPPYWEHFETEYTLLKPVYASQYQPAQGIVLAFGEVVFRHPWFGVWLSMGAMYAALCWGLSYVVPLRWALFGSVIAALQFGIFGLWMNSYFGGAVAAAAGALIMGSLVRMGIAGKARSSAALCAGALILLFASRPFEGVLWFLVAVVWVVFRIKRAPARPRWLSLALPFVAVFGVGAACLAWYNWRITGNPWNPPYLEYRRIYGTPQPFWWQGPITVRRFDFPELRNNYLNQVHLYEQRGSFSQILAAEGDRLGDFWRFFIGPLITPALIFLAFIFRDKRIRPWLLISIPFILDKATYHAWFPAQNAPETALIVLLIVQCWRHMAAWRRRRGYGPALSRQLVAASCAAIVIGGLGRAMEPAMPHSLRHLAPIWESLYPARRLREDVSARLEKVPGKHLLFVVYAPNHCFCEEWVFNEADLRSQKIVYARSFSTATDTALARYLYDHDVWVVEPDAQPYTLSRLDDSMREKIARLGTDSAPAGE